MASGPITSQVCPLATPRPREHCEVAPLSLFISFEGGEGSGKTTQALQLSQQLASAQVPVSLVREPGTTDLGWHIRRLVKGKPWGHEPISHGAELFLFTAARAELVTKVLKEQLKLDRQVIVADRYADSTLAYQGYGRKLPLKLVRAINGLATQDIVPDLTILLDCPPEDGLKRVGAVQIQLPFEEIQPGRLDNEGARKFEEEPLAFHQRVRAGFLQLAELDPMRWVVIDALLGEQVISEIVWEKVQPLLRSKRILLGEDELSIPPLILAPVEVTQFDRDPTTHT